MSNSVFPHTQQKLTAGTADDGPDSAAAPAPLNMFHTDTGSFRSTVHFKHSINQDISGEKNEIKRFSLALIYIINFCKGEFIVQVF